MKKNIYQSIIILILFLSIPYIKADCTTEEIKELKKETKQIKIIYEHKHQHVVLGILLLHRGRQKIILGIIVNHGLSQDFITRMASHIF